MKIIALSEQAYQEFAYQHSQFSTQQSIEHAKRRNIEYHFLGMEDESHQLVAAGLFFYRNVFLGYKEAQCQLGPLVNYNDQKLLLTFFTQLKEYLKKQRVYSLLINPNIINIARDENAEIIENGENNQAVIDSLLSMGFHEMNVDHHPYYFNWYFVKDLSDLSSEEDLIASYSTKTWYTIRKALASKIVVEEIDESRLQEFKGLMDESADTRNYSKRPLSYYQDLYHQFVMKGHGKFIIASLLVDDLLREYDEQIKIEQDLIDNTEPTSKKNRSLIKEANIRLESYLKKSQDLKNLNLTSSKVPLAAAFFYVYPNELIYFLSGMRQDLKQFDGPYAIQHHALTFALNQGIPRYNSYGTNGYFNNHPEKHGIYEFKKGFGGTIEELIGYYTLTINPLISSIIDFLKKLRRN